MERALFKDAVYSPKLCKLMLGLTIAGPMPEGVEGVREPYVLEVSIPNTSEAKAFLKSVGLDDLPFTCLEGHYAPGYHEGPNSSQGNTGTAFGLLKSIGGWGGSENKRRGSHPNAAGGDCYSSLEAGICFRCGYMTGDDAPIEDYPWLHEED